MLDENGKTFRAHPSLLQLRTVLIAAESGVPSSPDINEHRAQTLITGIRKEYRKPHRFSNWKGDSGLGSFRLQEVIVDNV